MIRIFYSFFILLTITAGVSAQLQPLYTNYEHFDTESGLPQSFVTDLVQDQDGFIWMSTLDGIARYDGSEFIYFNIDADDGRSLSTSQVYDLLLEGEVLWVMHHNYVVDQVNTKTLKVKRGIKPYAAIDKKDFLININVPSLNRFVSDRKENWFAGDTTKYYLYDSTNLKFKVLFEENQLTVNSPIHGYSEDSKGRLWFMTDKSLLVSNTEWDDFKEIEIPSRFNFSPDPGLPRPLIPLSSDRMFFSFGQRAFIYKESNDSFKELILPESANARDTGLNVSKDLQGRIIIINRGLVLRLEEDESITLIWENPAKGRFIINNILVDRSNTMWVGMNTGGMYKVDLNRPSFISSKYDRSFLADLLIDQMDVSESDLPENWRQIKGWSYGMRYSYSDLGLFLTHDSYGFGNYRRIYKYSGGKFIRLPLEDIYFQYIIGIAESDHALWALDIEGKMFQWKNLEEKPIEYQFKSLTKGPSTERLSDMVADDDYLWVIATKNILYKVKEGKQIDQYQVGKEGSSLIDLSTDISDPDILWIGTLGGGLVKWNKRKNETEAIYDTSDGLSNNSIGAVVPDSIGNIWLATFNGISRFDIDQERFTNYFTKDGLLESEFNRHHGFILPDGRIALGGTLGYSIFDPDYFISDSYQPEVNLSGLQINNEAVSLNDKQFAKGIIELKEIELSYDQNSLRIEMAAMQYNDPSANQYRYNLENYNSDWVENGDQRVVRFDNLPAGSYTLQLNASNTDGVWSDKIKSIQIHINPPPWLSWWAYIGYIIFIVFLIFVIWNNYKKRLQKKQEEEFNKREAERLFEMDEMKTRFFSNITHEFRTPLTLILSPLEKHIRDSNFPPKALEVLKSNYRHGSHLLKLVNQLLDIAKLESGNMQLRQASGELGVFVKNCVAQFETLASDKKISLSFSNKNVEGHYLFDQGHWEKILNNLLSNAIKFTLGGGQVSVALKTQSSDGELLGIVEVKDTGVGIAKDLLPKLFDRFYQVDDSTTRVQEGTGIGLSLVKELTVLMKGEVEVESEEGKGTKFTVRIPISKFVETSPSAASPKIEAGTNEKAVVNGEDPLLLVVEDNEELRAFITESLSEKWPVVEATNGKEALGIIARELPDIVISDVMMPEMNGVELCRMTKNDNRTAHVNFIMLTAKTAQESKEQGLEAGADDYLTKPFHLYELELRIQNLIQQQKSLREHLKSELLPESPMVKIPSVSDEFLNKVYRYLDDNLEDTTISVDMLAEEMAMSRSTLNRKLKALLNISTNEFIKRYRIRKAVEYINAGQNISEAAFSVGFENPSYFSQCFKETYNQSPSEYQRSLT